MTHSNNESVAKQKTLGAIFIIAVLLFAAIAMNVSSHGSITKIDAFVYHQLQSIRTPILDTLLITFTELGDTVVVVSVVVSALFFLLHSRAWQTATFWTVSILATTILNTGFKAAIGRTRPIDNLYSGWSNYSFPSGHSSINFVMYASIAIILIRQSQLRQSRPIAVAFLCVAFLIAFSRIYLGAHWASDVAAAICLGTAWLAFICLFHIGKPTEAINATAFIQIICIVLFIVGSFNIANQRTDNIDRYNTAPVAHLSNTGT